MLVRQAIRQAVIEILTDPKTPVTVQGDEGLTLAGRRVLDTHLDPLQLTDCQSDTAASDLPAIAVYTEMEELGVSDDSKFDELCFDKSQLTLVLELYICAANGYQLAALLDQFEEQVRIKLLKDARFYPLAKLRGYRSMPKRNGDGKKLGLRSIELTLEYGQSVDTCEQPADACESGLRINFEVDTPHYDKDPKQMKSRRL